VARKSRLGENVTSQKRARHPKVHAEEASSVERSVGVVPRVTFPDDPELAPDDWEREESRWWRVAVTSGPDYPFELDVRIGRLPDGRFACTGLRINNRGDCETEVTARTLREIRLPDIVKSAVHAAHAEDPAFSRYLLGYELPPVAARSRPRLRPGPPGYDNAFFQDVADLYKESMREDPAHPYKHFRAQWGGAPPSLSTARRWVQRARDKGLLRDAIPGKAGERPAKSGQS
jgi:hypothetical protein